MYLNLPEKICYTQEVSRPKKKWIALGTFTLSSGPQTTKLVDLVINLYLSSEGQSSRPVKPKIQRLELTEKEGFFSGDDWMCFFTSFLFKISCHQLSWPIPFIREKLSGGFNPLPMRKLPNGLPSFPSLGVKGNSETKNPQISVQFSGRILVQNTIF